MSAYGWLSSKLFPVSTLPERTMMRARNEGRRFRTLPHKIDFAVAGFERCGTTTLDDYLREHPQIGMGQYKELHFFERDRSVLQGKPDYSRYHRLFDHKRSIRSRGDATPGYVCDPVVVERLHDYNPDFRIVLLMRDPAGRTFSDWNRSVLDGSETLSFSQAIRSPRERVRLNWPLRDPKQRRWFSYLKMSYYDEQVENLLHSFPREQVLALKTEDMARDHQTVLNDVCRFLGVEEHRFAPARRLNSREYAAAMSDEDLSYLRSVFEPHIQALERLLGWDCSDWRA